MSYLFIVSVGRSGSTLLQSLLNCLEGVRINGENGIVVPLASGLANFQEGFKYAVNSDFSTRNILRGTLKGSIKEKGKRILKQTPAVNNAGHPWFSIDETNPSNLTEELRELILRNFMNFEKEYKTIGFKEIRWHKYRNVFEGMELLFPSAKYVFNYRNSNNIIESGWWKKEGYTKDLIDNAQEWMRSEARKLETRAFQINYEDYTNDLSSLESLQEFTGHAINWTKAESVMRKQLKH